MKQRTSYTLTVELDIVQQLPDESTHADVIAHIEDVHLTLEREVSETLSRDYGNGAKVVITKLPQFK